MGLKKRVFASRSEQANFYKLSRQWENRYRLYHNLPFLNVFEIYDHQPELTELERSRLKKTSIDYTLCDEHDAPLVCIEFDGLQDGFNLGQQYHSNVEPSNPWRDQIMALKLKVAHAMVFPFFVVGYIGFKDLTPSLHLTLVDGIIGEIFAGREVQRRIDRVTQGLEAFRVDWELTLPASRAEIVERGRELNRRINSVPHAKPDPVEDWLFLTRIRAELDNNPIYTERLLLMSDLFGPDAMNPELISCSAKYRPANATYKDATLVGSEAVVHTEDLGDVARTVFMPNFQMPGFMFTEVGLLNDMASLVALDAVRQQRERQLARGG